MTDRASKIAKEMEVKVGIFADGLNVPDLSICEEVGTRYNENINYVFDYTRADLPQGMLYQPSDLVFSEGTIVKFIYEPRSRYSLEREDDTLVVKKDGKVLLPVQFTERPDYYNKKTTQGNEMRQIVPFRGEDKLFVLMSNVCRFWSNDEQCRFCNIGPAKRDEKTSAVISQGILTDDKADEVGQCIKAAIDEGINYCLEINTGSMKGSKETEAAIRIIKAIKRYTGQDTLRGVLNMTAPKDLSDMDRLYEAGYRGPLTMNIECWNPDIHKAICPGKNKHIGHDHWKKALEYGVSVFGRGNVFSAMVFGIEEKRAYFEAAEWMGEKGIFPAFVPWWVQKGSNLADHRAPHPEWLLENHEKAVDIVLKGLPEFLEEETLRRQNGSCYRCSDNVLCWDELRRRLGGFDKVNPKEMKKAAQA